MDVNEQKKALRKELLAARNALNTGERIAMDARLAENVAGLPEYETARVLLPYLSFGTEVDTRAIICQAWADGKIVALPRCIPGTREMAWYRVDSLDGLVKSKLGVEEPPENPAWEIDPYALAPDEALVLVPGFTFDARGYRLGYGGGFYDVFLSRYNGKAAGLCRDPFFDKYTLTLGEFDLPVPLVITNTRIVRA